MNRKPVPNFTVPTPLKNLAARLPQTPPALVLVAALKLGFERIVPRDTLQPLLGKRFVIRVTDAGLTLSFGYSARGFHPVFDHAPADLTISACLRDYLVLLAREEDPDTLFFSRRLLMEGDTELGLLMKNTLDGLELPTLNPLTLINPFWRLMGT